MRILLATDGSATADATVSFVAGFPFPRGTEVILLGVLRRLDHRAETLDGALREALDRTHGTAEMEAMGIVNGQAEVLRGAGLSCTTQLRSGHPAEEIVVAAEEVGADLIAVGSHGLSGVRRFLLGSVSNQVMRSAHCSVLIVRQPGGEEEPERMPPQAGWRILVAYDDSEPAQDAVRFCASLPLGESDEVDILTVLPMVTAFRQDIRQELNGIWQQTVKAEKAALARAAAEIGRTIPNVRTELVESGDVSHAILAAGEHMGADLIIMGHKGKGGVERFLMGSVTPRVASHTSSSFLAIRT